MQNDKDQILRFIKSKGTCIIYPSCKDCLAERPEISMCPSSYPKKRLDKIIQYGLEKGIITEEDLFEEML